ncbi:uncharacterized protein HemY [Siphonobacter sp. SORGH_AS 1065]|nr:uncharacterized protein HemY [Siphonobacter sp. SORGH_AS_1065]
MSLPNLKNILMLTFLAENCNYFILICIVLGIHCYLKVHGSRKVTKAVQVRIYTMSLNAICVLGIGFWVVWFLTAKFS